MPRVMFTISYVVQPEKREEYLDLSKEMSRHQTTVAKKNYAVYETKGRKNHFTEIFTTASLEEFDTLEDDQDEKTQELVSRIQKCVDGQGMKYTTLVEVG